MSVVIAIVLLVLGLLICRSILGAIADIVRGTFLFTRGTLNIVNRTPPIQTGRILDDDQYREKLIHAGVAPRFVSTASTQELDYIGGTLRVTRRADT